MKMTRRKAKTVIIPSPVREVTILRIFSPLFHISGVLSALFLILLCLSPMAAVCSGAAPKTKRADQPYGLIYGTVWGPDSRPVYGVKVEVRRADQTKGHWQLYSDHQGEFAQRVPAGPADYIVRADVKGYKTLDKRPLRSTDQVKVHVNYDEREDIGLHLTY